MADFQSFGNFPYVACFFKNIESRPNMSLDLELLRKVNIDLSLESGISVRAKTGCVILIGDEYCGPLWGLCTVSLTELAKWLLKTVAISAGPLYRVPLSLISSCLVILLCPFPVFLCWQSVSTSTSYDLVPVNVFYFSLSNSSISILGILNWLDLVLGFKWKRDLVSFLVIRVKSWSDRPVTMLKDFKWYSSAPPAPPSRPLGFAWGSTH